MKRFQKLVASVVAALGVVAFAQDASTPSTNSAVAYVYVSTGSGNSYEINAYAASSDGVLTPISGSPYSTPGISSLALNNKWLFGANGIDIYVFAIASNGSLKKVSAINAQALNGYNDGGPVSLFLDRSGATLYDLDIYGNNGANNTYQFFSISQFGVLSYTGATTAASPEFMTPLSFIANNKYGYGSSNYHGFQNIYGFSRNSDGTLTDMNLNAPIPAAPKGAYGPFLAAADAANHVAISFVPTEDLTVVGPTQLASYTADNSGNVSTTNTSETMPVVAVGAGDMQASPAGDLLAVGGPKGLQVFHFNGANPITTYTGPLTTANVTQVFWDNANHLYAISAPPGELYVFTVTSTSVRQAPGSPYSIAEPFNIAVLPRE